MKKLEKPNKLLAEAQTAIPIAEPLRNCVNVMLAPGDGTILRQVI